MKTQTMTSQTHSGTNTNSNTKLAFYVLCSAFFMWAIPNNLQTIMMPQLQLGIMMNNFTTSLLDTNFYIGYFFAPIIAGLIANKLGYKSTIIIGFLIMALGSLLCFSALDTYTLSLFLGGLTTTALGCGFLETACNPLATVLGPKEQASYRINFAQIFNQVGNLTTASVGAIIIIGGSHYKTAEEIAKLPKDSTTHYHHMLVASGIPVYIFMAALLVCLSILFALIKFPHTKALDESSDGYFSTFKRVMKFSHFRWSLLAMFLMNGTQACMMGFFLRYAIVELNTDPGHVSFLASVLAIAAISGRVVGTYILKNTNKDGNVLGIFNALGVIACLAAVVLPGWFGIWSIPVAFFFLAPSYPTIFALGIKGLGKDTKIASSFMVMMIVGAGIIPVILGFLADKVPSFSLVWIIPALCMAMISYFGFKKSSL